MHIISDQCHVKYLFTFNVSKLVVGTFNLHEKYFFKSSGRICSKTDRNTLESNILGKIANICFTFPTHSLSNDATMGALANFSLINEKKQDEKHEILG